MDNGEKWVYVPMAVDTVHPGHMNIIKTAAALGKVMVGLFSDEAIASYKKMPLMHYEQRKCVIENIKGVDLVVKQDTRDYEPNLRRYKPAYMVHGTDWRTGPLADVREAAIALMKEWGGEVVEPEYTQGISSTELKRGMRACGVTTQNRQGALKQLLETKDFFYIAGVSDALSASVVAQAELAEPRKPKKVVDALFLETEHPAGLPMDPSRYLALVNEAASVSTLPLIISDTPFRTGEALEWGLKEAQRLGVSAITLSAAPGAALSVLDKLSLLREKRICPDFLAVPELAAGKDGSPGFLRACVEGGASAFLIAGNAPDALDLPQGCTGIPLLALADAGAKPRRSLRALGFRAVIARRLTTEPVADCIRKSAGEFLRME